MKLSISNIAWAAENDDYVYRLMKKYNFSGLEIAPSRIFAVNPYDQLEEAENWAKKLKRTFGFAVSSMQSIWYGRAEGIFNSVQEREELLFYTKKAIDFAARADCRNLVFGCPKNRIVPEHMSAKMTEEIAVLFFRELGEYACSKGTVIGIEANPSIYGTNYINTTSEALELIELVDSDGFRLNLDVGCMIQNGENVGILEGKAHLINHVHISEPGLAVIQKRRLHTELMRVLKEDNYRGFISIEMAKLVNVDELEKVMEYVRSMVL